MKGSRRTLWTIQKAPALFVPVADGGDKHTSNRHTNIATYRLNRPRGRFSEKYHQLGTQPYVKLCENNLRLHCLVRQDTKKVLLKAPGNGLQHVNVSVLDGRSGGGERPYWQQQTCLKFRESKAFVKLRQCKTSNNFS